MKVSLFVFCLVSFWIPEYSTSSEACNKSNSQPCKENPITNLKSSIESRQIIRDMENLNPDSEKPQSEAEVPKLGVSPSESGILNSFENATHWAVKEEKVFQLTKLLYRKIRAETLVLNEYIQDYESSARKHFLPKKLRFKTKKEKAHIIASSTIAAYRMTNRYVHLLQKLKDVMALNYIDTDPQDILEVECLTDSGEECMEYSIRVPGSLLTGWPNRLDLALAMHSLIHIQEVHNYNYTQLSEVLSPETKKPPELNAFHSAEIGKHALYRQHFAVAIEWMDHAANLVNNVFDSSIPVPVLESYLELAANLHNQQRTLQRTVPTKLIENLFLQDVNPFKQSLKSNERVSNLVLKLYGGSGKAGFESAYFNGICSGNDFRGLQELSSLYCWYDKSSSPARAIQPFKKELLSLKPEVVQVYDFLGDELISRMKNDKTNCTGISIAFDKTQLSKIMRYRTPTTCWPEHSKIQPFWNKIASLTLTDFRPKHTKEVASVDYLPGRFYVVHRDALQLFPTEHPGVQKRLQEDGDRLYSLVVYLNDVHTGGSTPFPCAGTAAPPVKGSVVFWKNIFKNGSAMQDTWHGSCPVIYGHKQVAVVLLHSNPQHLTHPCSLNQYE